MFWSGNERSPAAWAQLITGLFGYGLSISMMIESGLGLGPWDAFHVGLHRQTGMSVGSASIAAGLFIVAATCFIRVRPGVGTIANMVVIGLVIDLLTPLLPAAAGRVWGLGYYIAGILLCGLATGFYIGAGLGKGPRDGLMIGLSERGGWPVARVRTAIELLVLACGWAMGATIGIGTVLFALGIGPAVQWGLRVAAVPRSPRRLVVQRPQPVGGEK